MKKSRSPRLITVMSLMIPPLSLRIRQYVMEPGFLRRLPVVILSRNSSAPLPVTSMRFRVVISKRPTPSRTAHDSAPIIGDQNFELHSSRGGDLYLKTRAAFSSYHWGR